MRCIILCSACKCKLTRMARHHKDTGYTHLSSCLVQCQASSMFAVTACNASAQHSQASLEGDDWRIQTLHTCIPSIVRRLLQMASGSQSGVQLFFVISHVVMVPGMEPCGVFPS